jgi:penicillin-binding protein A
VYTFKKENAWRRYQADLILRKKKKTFYQGFGKTVLYFCLICLIFSAGLGAWKYFHAGRQIQSLSRDNTVLESRSVETGTKQPVWLSRTHVREMLREKDIVNPAKNIFFVNTPEQTFRIVTFLDMELTGFLTATLDHLKTLTRGKPRQIAMVVMDANTGHILSMAGFDLENPNANPCTSAIYPAASIFKIVTAAAAVDALKYTHLTPLYFNGNKYTLYKRQLKDVKNKYTRKVSLASAFAESINPVFGKLGQTYLGEDILSAYAHAFGFNRTPDTDLFFDPGRFSINEESFHLAELGCGFNRDTLISPVFGAMMVTPMLNRGQALVPAVVSHISDATGHTVYRYEKEYFTTAIAPESAVTMMDLMEKTVSLGTARKSFGSFSRDKVLSNLVIGGKTGSLSNREHTIKYDWFTGFGKEKTGNRAIVVSIVVGHGEYIGTRATTHARSILKHYFSTPASSG